MGTTLNFQFSAQHFWLDNDEWWFSEFSDWRFMPLCLAMHQWCLTGNPWGWCYYSGQLQEWRRRFISLLFCLFNRLRGSAGGGKWKSWGLCFSWGWKRDFFLQLLTLLQDCEPVSFSQNKQAWRRYCRPDHKRRGIIWGRQTAFAWPAALPVQHTR